MKVQNFFISTCRYCRYYKHEGRRGGMCHRLEVPVESQWKTCSLAIPPFGSAWKTIRPIAEINNLVETAGADTAVKSTLNLNKTTSSASRSNQKTDFSQKSIKQLFV